MIFSSCHFDFGKNLKKKKKIKKKNKINAFPKEFFNKFWVIVGLLVFVGKHDLHLHC